MRFGIFIRTLRTAREWSQEDLADKCGVARSTIIRKERTAYEPDDIDRKTLILLAKAFDMEVDELVEKWRAGESKVQLTSRRPAPAGVDRGIPVLSDVPAGRGDLDPTLLGLDDGLGGDYIARGLLPWVKDPNAYALTVAGDSMEPTYMAGDLVVCSPLAKHDPGMVAAIRFGSELDDEATLKRVRVMPDGQLLLEPDNKAHQPRIVDRKHIVRMDRVVGKISKVE